MKINICEIKKDGKLYGKYYLIENFIDLMTYDMINNDVQCAIGDENKFYELSKINAENNSISLAQGMANTYNRKMQAIQNSLDKNKKILINMIGGWMPFDDDIEIISKNTINF